MPKPELRLKLHLALNEIVIQNLGSQLQSLSVPFGGQQVHTAGFRVFKLSTAACCDCEPKEETETAKSVGALIKNRQMHTLHKAERTPGVGGAALS